MRTAGLLLAILAAAGLLAVHAAIPARAQACVSSGVLTVSGGAGTYKLNPDNYGGGNAAVCNSDGDAAFTVQSQTASGSSPVAYPNLDAGCNSSAGGNCSAGWTQQKYSALGTPAVTFARSGSTGGADEWDELIDSWWAPASTGCPDVEIGVMINGKNLPAATGTQVTINGKTYWYKIVARSGVGCSWTYYLFRRAAFTASVSGFAIKAVFAYVHNNGMLPSSDQWRYCGGGFELWSGGAGLQATAFSVSQ